MDVNIAARVGDAAKADQVLVSDVLLTRIELGDLKLGEPSACGPTALRADCTWRRSVAPADAL